MHRRPLRRRNSLPETSPFFALSKDRVVPEGSNDFQKTLNELYNPPPKNPPPFGGLANITEGEDEENETEEIFEEDENEYEKKKGQKTENGEQLRRHSSPAALHHENKTFDPNTTSGEEITHSSSGQQHKRIEGVFKTQDKARREFFVKHGRWPTENYAQKRMVKSSTNPGRGKMSTEVAFWTCVSKLNVKKNFKT
ncbi:hypothetical protein CHS0354_011018 [Potamilus streckersoni]|uniref:Uncharacterized protein n=1 Tax=Potamilus streckersoni TaxID=2493646 RepID=A0AAE0WFY0_9BIVA|nr:hypothetical protein CHS0354_011018 [Potamilus streckersoni]